MRSNGFSLPSTFAPATLLCLLCKSSKTSAIACIGPIVLGCAVVFEIAEPAIGLHCVAGMEVLAILFVTTLSCLESTAMHRPERPGLPFTMGLLWGSQLM